MADEERDEKSRNIKVTDRRMFTPDGKLKEEYRWLEEAQAPKDEAAGEPAAPPEREASTTAGPGTASPAEGDARGRPGEDSPERRQGPPQETAASDTPRPEPSAAPGAPGPAPSAAPGPSAEAAPWPAPSAAPGPTGEATPGPAGTPLELPDTPDSLGKPGFLDLLAVLAEPATIYLGDAALPDGSQAEDLRAARVYIDMLTVLREKTNGNLSAQERVVMDDLLYRLQMRYIQKRG